MVDYSFPTRFLFVWRNLNYIPPVKYQKWNILQTVCSIVVIMSALPPEGEVFIQMFGNIKSTQASEDVGMNREKN